MTERNETTRRTTNQQRNRIKSKISTTTTKKEVNETQQKNGLKWTSSSSRTTVKVVGRLGRRFPTKEKNEWKGPTTTSNNSSPFENKKEEEAVLPSFSLPGFYRVGSRLIKEDEILLVSISSQKKKNNGYRVLPSFSFGRQVCRVFWWFSWIDPVLLNIIGFSLVLFRFTRFFCRILPGFT